MPLRFTASALTDLARLATRDGSRGRPGTIVHLLPTLGWGGAERLACTFHRLCLDAGLRSRIDAPATEALREALREEIGDTMDVPRRGDERALRDWALGARARIARERPALVHAHLPFPDRLGAAVLAARGRPFIATFQLLPQPDRWPLDGVTNLRSDTSVAAIARVRRAARFVGVSRADVTTLSSLIAPGRVVHIANAPPLPRVHPRTIARDPWLEGHVRLLSVGRLEPQKGFDQLLDALASHELRALPWHWRIAGGGSMHADLLRTAHEHGLAGRVTIDGDAPADAVFPEADLVLSPSRYEGMPLVPMEAVAAGVPVVASSIEPHRELLSACPGALLDPDLARWPSALATLVADADARAALLASERRALPTDPRATMWNAYSALYRTVAASL